jgi:hypothetical protein
LISDLEISAVNSSPSSSILVWVAKAKFTYSKLHKVMADIAFVAVAAMK